VFSVLERELKEQPNMKIYVATIGNESWNKDAAEEFRALAARDQIQQHSLTDDPEEADVVLFVDLQQHPDDWQLKTLRNHPLAKQYPLKTMVYDERDYAHCIFPGLFVSMPAPLFDATRQRACSFYTLKNELMQPTDGEPDLLFSFMGAKSHPARKEILKLKHPRAVVEDTTQVNFFDYSEKSHTQEYKTAVQLQKERYQEIVARSKFVLCPRGMGTSSFRLYETLAVGRVPVIISDDWVPSPAPDWNACSVRVAQNEVASIPAILERREADWPAMAWAARATFQEWMAPDVLFHRLSEECQWLLTNGQLGAKPFPLGDAAFRRNGVREGLNALRRLRADARKKLKRL